MCDYIAYNCDINLARRLSSLLALRKQGTVGKTHLARNLGQPPADSQREMEAFSPIAPKEMNAADSHMSLDVGPSLEP